MKTWLASLTGCFSAVDSMGVSSPYFFSSAIILATLSLGFGLDQYARPGLAVASAAGGNKREAVERN
jgi:hypothetical protein